MCSSLKGNAEALFNFAPGKVVGGLRRYDPIGVLPLNRALANGITVKGSLLSPSPPAN
ncbi:hypothetical protein I6H07_17185 [Hafnia alvei]|uniref:hypothetical protein n=1 Tax=Hafnia alvei TaxID=569 RepID=UPI001642EDF0|nr:hypothetical protein [Hafnia alvei]MBI0277509.1 hypothetical protein [Hafnia alvei]